MNPTRLEAVPGDVVEIGFATTTALGGWGEGLERMPVEVLDRSPGGRYVGLLPDGSTVRFETSNILGFSNDARLSGIFDWLRRMRPPIPGAPAPAEPSLPALPAPAVRLPAVPPEGGLPAPSAPPRRTFVEAFKSFFRAKPAEPGLPTAPGEERRSIFEAFRPKEAARESYLPAAPVQAGPPAPFVPKGPSLFAPLAPEVPGLLEKFRPTGFDVLSPEAPGALIPAPPKSFEVFRQEPETEAQEAERKMKQLQLWTTLFPEEAPEPTAEQMFRPFAPIEVEPEPAAAPAPAGQFPGGLPRSAKVLPLPARWGLLPSTDEVTRGFLTLYDPVEGLWDMIRQMRAEPDFLADLAHSGRTGEPAKRPIDTLGVCGGRPDIFEETASFFHIPWEEMRKRMRVRRMTYQGEEVEAVTPTDAIFEDILYPLKLVVEDAFRKIKPADIPGQIVAELGMHGDRLCQFIIAYEEGDEPGAPGAEPPPGTLTLGEIVPKEAAQAITDTLNRASREGAQPIDALAQIIEILKPYEKSIQEKGFVIEYLAAIIIFGTPEAAEDFLTRYSSEIAAYTRTIESRARSIQEMTEKAPKRQISLEELLPPEGLARVKGVIDQAVAEQPSVQELHRRLIQALLPYRERLEDQGVVPEYLAYSIEAQMTGQAEAPPEEETPRPKKKRKK